MELRYEGLQRLRVLRREESERHTPAGQHQRPPEGPINPEPGRIRGRSRMPEEDVIWAVVECGFEPGGDPWNEQGEIGPVNAVAGHEDAWGMTVVLLRSPQP